MLQRLSKEQRPQQKITANFKTVKPRTFRRDKAVLADELNGKLDNDGTVVAKDEADKGNPNHFVAQKAVKLVDDTALSKKPVVRLDKKLLPMARNEAIRVKQDKTKYSHNALFYVTPKTDDAGLVMERVYPVFAIDIKSYSDEELQQIKAHDDPNTKLKKIADNASMMLDKDDEDIIETVDAKTEHSESTIVWLLVGDLFKYKLKWVDSSTVYFLP